MELFDEDDNFSIEGIATQAQFSATYSQWLGQVVDLASAWIESRLDGDMLAQFQANAYQIHLNQNNLAGAPYLVILDSGGAPIGGFSLDPLFPGSNDDTAEATQKESITLFLKDGKPQQVVRYYFDSFTIPESKPNQAPVIVDGPTFSATGITVTAQDANPGDTLFLAVDTSPATTILGTLEEGASTLVPLAASTNLLSGTLTVLDSAGARADTGYTLHIGTDDLGTHPNNYLDASASVQAVAMYGFAGDDTITGSSLNDFIFGGTGADHATGGAGADMLDGGAGPDHVYYREVTSANSHGLANIAGMAVNLSDQEISAETIRTEMGGGIVLGGGDGVEGGNLAAGSAGYLATSAAGSTTGMVRDTLISFEVIHGSDLADYLAGGMDTWIFGYAGNDHLFGSTGSDFLFGGSGDDIINGGAGTDYMEGGAGADVVDGGADYDWVYYTDVTNANSHGLANIAGMAVNLSDQEINAGAISAAMGGGIVLGGGDGVAGSNLAAGSAGYLATSAAGSTAGMVRDTLISIERVIGSELADYLVGSAEGDHIYGYSGNDYISGGASGDHLTGNAGADVLYGDTGGDYVEGGAGADHLDGGADYDIVNFSDLTDVNTHGLANVAGMAINLSGQEFSAGAISAAMGGGIVLGGGDGTEGGNLAAGSAGYLATSAAGSTAGMVRDTLIDFEAIYGSGLADFMVGNAGSNVLNAFTGNDYLVGGAGADYLYGGDGMDRYIQTAGATGTVTTGGTTVSSAVADVILVNLDDNDQLDLSFNTSFGLTDQTGGSLDIAAPSTDQVAVYNGSFASGTFTIDSATGDANNALLLVYQDGTNAQAVILLGATAFTDLAIAGGVVTI